MPDPVIVQLLTTIGIEELSERELVIIDQCSEAGCTIKETAEFLRFSRRNRIKRTVQQKLSGLVEDVREGIHAARANASNRKSTTNQ